MTKQQIITKFELYMDDTTNLSASEESDLFDKIFQRVYNDKPLEITKAAATGTLSTSVPTIALPSDFAYFVANHNYTELNMEASGPVIFVGSTYKPYKVVSWSDRRQYLNQDGYCYVDIKNKLIYFAQQPVIANSYEFDYHAIPTNLALSDTPSIPSHLHDVFYHGMCVDDFIIQQSDKAKSYAQDNQAMFDKYMLDIAYWNANLVQLS